jgi:putative nucleotidyltransferase with HDIG domain
MSSIDTRILRNRVENIKDLPTIPSVLKQLSLIIENPRVSLNEITHFVSNDPALTSKILKMVNSAIYGFPGRISSVSHAIMLLGLNVVKGLLLGVSVFEVMHNAMGGLREHSLACAATARIIAKRKGIKEPEEVSVAGLLHDIGKVILALEFPSEYTEAMRVSLEKGMAISEAERIPFSETHAAIGYWLAEKWRFPRRLTEIIECHHNPQLSINAPLETAIVHFADILVRGKGIGFAGDPYIPAIYPAAFDLIDFSDLDLKEVLKEMEEFAAESLDGSAEFPDE